MIAVQRWLAQDLCATGRAAEGDSIVRTALANTPSDPPSAMLLRLQAVHGLCLVERKQYGEAETVLLAAERGLREQSTPSASLRAEVVRWLVRLYEGWGKPAEAGKWKVPG